MRGPRTVAFEIGLLLCDQLPFAVHLRRPVAVGEARGLRLLDVPARLGHAQGLEDALAVEGVDGLAGDGLDDGANNDVAGVILVRTPGVEAQGQARQSLRLLDGGAVAGILVAWAQPTERRHLGSVQIAVTHRHPAGAGDTGRIAEEVPHSDLALRRLGQESLSRRADAGAFERRDELRDWIVRSQTAFLEENHRCQAGDRLRIGVQAEQRVPAHRAAALDVHVTLSLEVDHATVAGDQRDEVGHLAGIDVALHGRSNPGEAFGNEPGFGGVSGGQRRLGRDFYCHCSPSLSASSARIARARTAGNHTGSLP